MSAVYLIPVGILTYFLSKRLSRPQEKPLPPRPYIEDLEDGPKPSSWLGGNMADLLAASTVGAIDQEYIQKHGTAFKFKGTFGRSNALYLADPKGLNYVLNTCAYTFERAGFREINRLFLGNNLLTTENEDHAKQRKILLPAFSQLAIKDIFPSFIEVTEKVATKWKELCQNSDGPSVVNVHDWCSRLTLDAIGQGAFSYDFGALGDEPSEYLQAWRALFTSAQAKPTTVKKFGRALAGLEILEALPIWLLWPIGKLILSTSLVRKFRNSARNIASEILEKEKKAAAGQAPEGKDIMSVLVRSNLSEESKRKMSDEELLGQLIVFTIAGHDPASTALAWLFYELARHPDYQEKIRAEVKQLRAEIGDRDFTTTDIESLPHIAAAIKETLRLYPFGSHTLRRATKDEIVPLSEPIKLRNGQMTDHITVRAGQNVILSFTAYNRLKELWGEDADVWNPNRFLREREKDVHRQSLGVYANLLTFSSGVHSCIGWRFAVLQTHVIAALLIERFEFSPPPASIEVYRPPVTGMLPFVKGSEKEGSQLPLNIQPL